MSLNVVPLVVLLSIVVCRNAIEEGPTRRAAIHATTLRGPRGAGDGEAGVERLPLMLDGLELGLAVFDAEVLAEEPAMEALDDPVRLQYADLGFAVLDAFELKEKLVGMAICR